MQESKTKYTPAIIRSAVWKIPAVLGLSLFAAGTAQAQITIDFEGDTVDQAPGYAAAANAGGIIVDASSTDPAGLPAGSVNGSTKAFSTPVGEDAAAYFYHPAGYQVPIATGAGWTTSTTDAFASGYFYLDGFWAAPRVYLDGTPGGLGVGFGAATQSGQGNVLYAMTGSGTQLYGDSIATDTWYQIGMAMDFTANGGDGSASYYYRTDLNANGDFTDEEWIADTILSSVNLELSENPDFFTQYAVGFRVNDDSVAFIDDIYIGTAVIPEPSTTALLIGCLGLGAAVCSRRKRL
jgi:hypothetical protein